MTWILPHGTHPKNLFILPPRELPELMTLTVTVTLMSAIFRFVQRKEWSGGCGGCQDKRANGRSGRCQGKSRWCGPKDQNRVLSLQKRKLPVSIQLLFSFIKIINESNHNISLSFRQKRGKKKEKERKKEGRNALSGTHKRNYVLC